ncbi:hypothetical protein [Roseinatronobacter alkalisoli]|uniref:MmcQ/YjbR family DNA-binding protein n=1 Tax=Roseinatronobacter alkalisoli TaxID=3028235 RepID=A0ABT5T8W8_9RHOB|nr:hypothetical protein [Roseinatronobacter sp. HJB301]MDD7970816.1 hypothetical protein [Roseinatronobacter sp. HJB301]
MHWNDVVTMALRWPEVAEATSYGEPSLKVRKRLLARLRLHDDSIVLLGVPVAEREHLIELMPEAFFCEPHYAGYDIVLARLAHIPAEVLERILERRWRSSATRRAIADFDQ